MNYYPDGHNVGIGMVYDAPDEKEVERLQKRVQDIMEALEEAIKLLGYAQCPNCDGCGFVVRESGGCDTDGENDYRSCVQEQCQWCDEKNKLIASRAAVLEGVKSKEGKSTSARQFRPRQEP